MTEALHAGPGILANSIADLSPERQWNLLWHHISRQEFPDIWPFAASYVRCGQPWSEAGSLVDGAALGSDGRYHPVRDGDPVCLSHHSQHIVWSTDGTSYWINVRNGVSTPSESMAVEWDVEMLDGLPLREMRDVPLHKRCPLVGAWWPPMNNDSPAGRQRALLLQTLGPACSICRIRMALGMDHSAATGLVRGHLCRHCNNVVEHCLHVSGCRVSNYLDHPPAEHLQFIHADHRKRMSAKRSQARLRSLRAHLAIDPIKGGQPDWGAT